MFRLSTLIYLFACSLFIAGCNTARPELGNPDTLPPIRFLLTFDDGADLIVEGDVIVQTANGALVMQSLGSGLGVYGDILFDGASSTGRLTGGSIQVLGDFTAQSTHSPTSFHSTGTLVRLTTVTDLQTVALDNPAQQRFADLDVTQSGQGSRTFESSAIVTGTLLSSNAALRGQGGAVLEVRGTLDLDVVGFDGLPLRLVSGVAPNAHRIDGVTFTNMPGGSSHLLVQLPGGGVNAPLTLNAPVFAQPPTGGGYHLDVLNATPQGQLLQIVLVSPSPGQPPLNGLKLGTNVQVSWP